MFRYSCFGHKDGSITMLQCNSLVHAQEWLKQNTETGNDALPSWIWDFLEGKRI
jgi:hypothetical protein